MTEEEEEIEDLKELLEEPMVGSRRKTPSLYSALGKEEFIMKGKDQKHRLDERHKQIAAATAEKVEDDDDNDDEEEMEKQKLVHETKELQSQLQKAECASALARVKEEREQDLVNRCRAGLL